MKLYEERYVEKPKKSKIPMIIGICIGVLIIITFLIIYMIVYLESTVVRITLDGADASQLEKIFYIEQTENGANLYIPIRGIAEAFNYQSFSGDYKYKSEDQTKCYVTNEIETAMFTLDSNILIKTRGDSDYEYIELDEKVFEKDGQLYTTIDGIKKAYNVELSFDAKKNKIDIYTMDYLVQTYATYLEIEEYSTVFTDKKAVFENMIIIKNQDKYGVINVETEEAVLETKYDLIEYLPNTKDFLVESNGKFGVLSKEANTKIKIAYDSIKIMDNQHGLYLIMLNNLYGVINTEGNTIIEPEYQQIGIGSNNFEQNGVENQYILLDELIPIKSGNKWGFFDIKGEQKTEFKYSGIGCTTSKVASSYPVLVIPSYKIIVVQEENKFYNLMLIKDNKIHEIVPSGVLDSVYMRSNTETGENTFYMTYNGQTENIEERLSKLSM